MSPESSTPKRSRDDLLHHSRHYCRTLATGHYENFVVASILLPHRMRQPFYNIYAFCRTADDFADESPNTTTALEKLNQLRQDLERTFSDSPPDHGLFPALGETINAFRLEKQPFLDLLSAFRQDQTKTHYDTMDELLDYCCRSANPVGHMVLQLADSHHRQTQTLSDEICTGLQLVNFAQDVGRDHQIGRIYLPRESRDQFGVQREMLQDKSTPPQLKALLAWLCDEAESRFQTGLPLANHVPSWLAKDIRLFAHGGLATVNAIRKIDFDVLRHRPTVGKWKQMSLLARAFLGTLR